jgi:multiple antibiotic resistance protein
MAFTPLLFATVAFNLFLIVDPVAAVPVFLYITKENTKGERRKMVLKACIVAFLVLAFFAVIGRSLLEYFKISTGAVRIAGGILLFGIGMEMLYGRVSRTETTEHEEKEAMEKQDISVTPLAIPLLSGPGAIAATMLFSHPDNAGALVVIAALLAVLLISWVILSLSEEMHRVLGQIGLKVIGRVMGLLLTFVAAQLFIDGLKAVGLIAGG